MQTAQLTFNGRTVTEFFAGLFLFRGIPMSWKGPRPAELSAIRNLLGSFLYFWGHALYTFVGPRYTAPKISAISYLFGTFSLLIMGDTERPRYTGFRGISVRGITALQCTSILVDKISISLCRPPFFKAPQLGSHYHLMAMPWTNGTPHFSMSNRRFNTVKYLPL